MLNGEPASFRSSKPGKTKLIILQQLRPGPERRLPKVHSRGGAGSGSGKGHPSFRSVGMDTDIGPTNKRRCVPPSARWLVADEGWVPQEVGSSRDLHAGLKKSRTKSVLGCLQFLSRVARVTRKPVPSLVDHPCKEVCVALCLVPRREERNAARRADPLLTPWGGWVAALPAVSRGGWELARNGLTDCLDGLQRAARA